MSDSLDDEIDELARKIERDILRNYEYLESVPEFEEGRRARLAKPTELIDMQNAEV